MLNQVECRRSGVMKCTYPYSHLLTLLLSLVCLTRPAAAGTYVDPQSGYQITFEGEVSTTVLELLVQKINLGGPLFNRSKIYWNRDVGHDAVLVRTATKVWLVQTDLKMVEAMDIDVLRVWNDLIVYTDKRTLGTMDRRSKAVRSVHKLPARGEGDAQWSVDDQGSSLALQMHWVPHGANLAVECASYLFVPNYKIQHTREGSFHFKVSADGSITESSTWCDVLSSALGKLLK